MGERLYPKYNVQKVGSKGELIGPRMHATDPDDVDSPFVLMPRKDPAAYYALLQYAQVCEEDLAREIRVWAEKIAEAPPVFGTQGARNHTHQRVRMMEMIT